MYLARDRIRSRRLLLVERRLKRIYPSQVHRALERREFDREATCGSGVLRRELIVVEGWATQGAAEVAALRRDMGFVKEELSELEGEFDACSATAARERRRVPGM